ncbi:MAG: hypothetical protein H8E26_08590 [FCB group bacterium]|nr:hypothetical protein [FCB group bacterium]MBL7028441.1 hypothetical protein [Candidatus Neomarinimicrobiota bacterium]MBL7122355.1 hypothetical protein [Candidatus Neomarinimicrobiota bacterium]
MFKISRSYILSVLLTTFMATCVCAQSLPAEEMSNKSPGVGDAFPHFQLTSTEYESIDLYDYLQTDPVVLIYYRGGW